MATIINNPDSGGGNNNGSNVGTIIGLIVLALIAILFFMYGLPAMRGNAGTSGGNSTTIEVPDKVEVDVNK